MTNDDIERFWKKVDKRSPDECWEWKGWRTGRNGYGQFIIQGHRFRAHRVAWELSTGISPNGLLVCHHCDNKPCCNPSHLFLGTVSDNARDMVKKGKHPMFNPKNRAKVSVAVKR